MPGHRQGKTGTWPTLSELGTLALGPWLQPRKPPHQTPLVQPHLIFFYSTPPSSRERPAFFNPPNCCQSDTKGAQISGTSAAGDHHQISSLRYFVLCAHWHPPSPSQLGLKLSASRATTEFLESNPSVRRGDTPLQLHEP